MFFFLSQFDILLNNKGKQAIKNYYFLKNSTSPKNDHEKAYLNLIEKVISTGSFRKDRTKTNTLACFAETLEFSLERNTLPLLTTKYVNYRLIIEELLWMLRGSCDSKELSKKNVKIWDKNGSREFLDKQGFPNREVGDLGPVYGFQWRHSGAAYIDCNTDYSGKGVDQISKVLNLIKTDPYNRRILLNAWNVKDVPLMVLPPCHLMVQFFVEPLENYNSIVSFDNSIKKGFLSALVYMRSCDIGIGLPFNIAFYATLVHLFAKMANYEAKCLKFILCDAHVYTNHINVLREQVKRTPYPFPKIYIKDSVCDRDFADFCANDFILNDYKHHDKIFLPFSA